MLNFAHKLRIIPDKLQNDIYFGAKKSVFLAQ